MPSISNAATSTAAITGTRPNANLQNAGNIITGAASGAGAAYSTGLSVASQLSSQLSLAGIDADNHALQEKINGYLKDEIADLGIQADRNNARNKLQRITQEQTAQTKFAGAQISQLEAAQSSTTTNMGKSAASSAKSAQTVADAFA